MLDETLGEEFGYCKVSVQTFEVFLFAIASLQGLKLQKSLEIMNAHFFYFGSAISGIERSNCPGSTSWGVGWPLMGISTINISLV